MSNGKGSLLPPVANLDGGEGKGCHAWRQTHGNVRKTSSPEPSEYSPTPRDLDNARDLIAAAMAGGRFVQIAYVHRPVELAMKFAIERATKKGMYVAPARLGEDHWKAQNNLLILADEYANEPSVEILVFDSRGRKEDIRQVGHGVDFFNAPENVAERYADKDSTIKRAVEADGGEIAARMDARNVATGKSGGGPHPAGD